MKLYDLIQNLKEMESRYGANTEVQVRIETAAEYIHAPLEMVACGELKIVQIVTCI